MDQGIILGMVVTKQVKRPTAHVLHKDVIFFKADPGVARIWALIQIEWYITKPYQGTTDKVTPHHG